MLRGRACLSVVVNSQARPRPEGGRCDARGGVAARTTWAVDVDEENLETVQVEGTRALLLRVCLTDCLTVWSQGSRRLREGSIDTSLSPVRELRTVRRLPHSGLCECDNRWKHKWMVPACVRRDGRSRGESVSLSWSWGLGLTIDGTAARDLRWGMFVGGHEMAGAGAGAGRWQQHCSGVDCGRWPGSASPPGFGYVHKPSFAPWQRPWTCTLCSIEESMWSLEKRGPTLERSICLVPRVPRPFMAQP